MTIITRAEIEALAGATTVRRCAHGGGAPQGERHGKAKLSNPQVRAMRLRYAAMRGSRIGRHRYGYANVAREFGCAAATARDIVKGWTRKDAGGPIFDEPDA